MRGGRHMLTMQGISARKSAVAPVLAVVLVLLCTLWPAPSRAWPPGRRAAGRLAGQRAQQSPLALADQASVASAAGARPPSCPWPTMPRTSARPRPAVSSRPNAAPLAAPRRPETSCPCWNRASGRLKVAPAAVTNTDSVLLGDIAAPLGHMDPALWGDLKSRRALARAAGRGQTPSDQPLPPLPGPAPEPGQ